jgi:hypothetical protein
VPTDVDVRVRVRQWLADHAGRVTIAQAPHAK